MLLLLPIACSQNTLILRIIAVSDAFQGAQGREKERELMTLTGNHKTVSTCSWNVPYSVQLFLFLFLLSAFLEHALYCTIAYSQSNHWSFGCIESHRFRLRYNQCHAELDVSNSFQCWYCETNLFWTVQYAAGDIKCNPPHQSFKFQNYPNEPTSTIYCPKATKKWKDMWEKIQRCESSPHNLFDEK